MSLIHVNDNNFESEVLNAEIPVLVDFWGEGCPPCKMIAPIIEDFSQGYEGKVKVAKANVEENPEGASKYQITAIPTLILFVNGERKDEILGLCQKDKLEELVKNYI